MRVTSKGQVTIPQAVRRRLGILPDSDVEIAVRGNEAVIRKVAGSARGLRAVAALRGRGSVRMRTEDILALTRGRR
jgi:antitoxin PrlF